MARQIIDRVENLSVLALLFCCYYPHKSIHYHLAIPKGGTGAVLGDGRDAGAGIECIYIMRPHIGITCMI